MPEQTELEELRVAELREKAKDAGVSGASHMRKDELIESLNDESDDDSLAADQGGDVLAVLKADHEKVKALFGRALELESGDADIEDLAEQIIIELKLHTEAEEQIFYPALKTKALDANEDDAKNEVLEAYIEHGSVKELIAKIEAMEPSDESYKAVLQVMSEQVEHHVEEEESEMFKQARELLSELELRDIGEQIRLFKESAAESVA